MVVTIKLALPNQVIKVLASIKIEGRLDFS
jgi:hypothetical protein